jgi:D-proline reductase (dithiol) PrdB
VQCGHIPNRCSLGPFGQPEPLAPTLPTRRLISENGPEIARLLGEDKVDAVFLAPVCPFCHQAAGLLQSLIEKVGIPTVSISLLMDVTKRVEPPRVLAVNRPLGYPLGEPNNPDVQKQIMQAAFELLPRASADPLLVNFNE